MSRNNLVTICEAKKILVPPPEGRHCHLKIPYMCMNKGPALKKNRLFSDVHPLARRGAVVQAEAESSLENREKTKTSLEY